MLFRTLKENKLEVAPQFVKENTNLVPEKYLFGSQDENFGITCYQEKESSFGMILASGLKLR